MGIVSYAQNFEDVMLWRALGHIDNGFYIDVGANDPVVDSVSLVFHEHGWRGIHVEPMTSYADMLRNQRPGDQIVQAAIGTEATIIRFYEIPGEGISTGDPAIAQQHRERGFQVNEIKVPSITLSAILDSCEAEEVHWLKIDVEGFEKQAIESWAPSKVRPWIVVVESTLPMTQIPSHQEWESILIGYGYKLVYFDGLNRYYLSNQHKNLEQHFTAPPNVFDGFTLNGTAHAPFHIRIEKRYQEKLAEANQELEGVLKAQILREQEVSEHIQSIQQKAENEKAALRTRYQSQIEAIQKEQEEHKALATRHIEELNDALRKLHESKLHREQEYTEKLLTVLPKTKNNETESLHERYQQKIEKIERQRAENEWLSGERIYALNQALQQAQAEKTQREQELYEQILNIEQKANEEKTGIHQHYQAQLEIIEREQDEHRWLTEERIHNLTNTAQNLQAELARREQAHNEQLLAARHQAEEDKAGLRNHYQTKMAELQQQQAEHEWLTAERINNLNQEIQKIYANHLECKQQLLDTTVASSNEIQKILKEKNHLSIELNNNIINTRNEISKIKEEEENRCATEIRILQAEIKEITKEHENKTQSLNIMAKSEKARNIELNKYLAEEKEINKKLAGKIDSTSKKLNILKYQLSESQIKSKWKLKNLLGRSSNDNETHIEAIQNIQNELTTYTDIFESETNQSIIETAEEKTSKQESNEMQKTHLQISNVGQLLSFHDKHFVQYAYEAILKRPPDPEGLEYYLNRIRNGVSKVQILAQLTLSEEGKKSEKEISGLTQKIKTYKKEKYPVIGWIYRLTNTDRGNEISKKLRAIENIINRNQDETNSQYNKILKLMSEMKYQIGTNKSINASMLENHIEENFNIDHDANVAKLNAMTPQARKIYFNLTTAIASKKGDRGQ